MINVVVDKLTR